MSLKYLTNLTGWTGGFSGGQSEGKDPFGMLSTHAPFPLDAFFYPAETSASFSATITHGGNSLCFSAVDHGHEALYRTIASLLVWQIPSEGLQESIESLFDIRTHYCNRARS